MHAMRRMLAGVLAIVGQAIGLVCNPNILSTMSVGEQHNTAAVY